MVYWGKKKSAITSEEDLVQRVESLTHDTTEIKHDISLIKSDIETLKRDESELGHQVSNIQSGLNDLVRKDTTLDNLCKVEQCAWAKDVTSQLESNATAIRKVEEQLGGVGEETRDIIFMTTKEITVTLTNQQLVGSFYWYEWEYNITEWDNAQYQLEGLIYKNLHKDDSGNHGQVEPKTKKALVTITYDDTNMYGTIQTPNMLDTGSNVYRLVVTCLWKKVL